MKKLSQLALFLMVSLLFTACSQGYYAHVPRAKKAYTKTEVEPAKKQQEVGAEEVGEIAATITLEGTEINNTATEVTETNKEVVTEMNTTETTQAVKLPTFAKKVVANKVNKITEKLEPNQTEKTQNVSNGTALILIIIGLVLGLLGGGFGGIGYILVVVGVILLLLNLLGASY